MNCRDFQERLLDFLDEALSAGERREAEGHLAACEGCRDALREHVEFAGEMAEHFRRATQSLELDPEVRRSVLAALSGHHAAKHELRPARPALRQRGALWERLQASRLLLLESLGRVLRPPLRRWVAAAGLLALAAMLGIRWPGIHSMDLPNAGAAELGVTVSARIPGAVTQYTFRREGRFVTDALVTSARIVQATVWANHDPEPDTQDSSKP